MGWPERYTESEIDVIYALAPDWDAIAAKLNRSRRGVFCMGKKLNIVKGGRPIWTAAEVALVKRMLADGKHHADISVALVRWTPAQVSDMCFKRKLRWKKPAAYKPTGNAVVDAVKARCKALGYSMADLDEWCGGGRHWRRMMPGHIRTKAYSWARIVRAVDVLGGSLNVSFPEKEDLDA